MLSSIRWRQCLRNNGIICLRCGSRRHHPYVRDEAVSPACDRLDEPRAVGRISQGLANLAYGGVDAGVHIHEDIFTPELIDDLGPRHQMPAALDEQDEQVHRLAFEPNEAAAATQLVRGRIEFVIAEAERFGEVLTGHHRAIEGLNSATTRW